MIKSGLGTKESTLSACMIVKNEEELLPRCLESIKDFVDEIIIVDTGSTDRTMEIARSYGAVVYEHSWTPWDFSAARNKAMEYCTKEWFFVIDADEELVFGNQVTPSMMKRWLGGMTENKNAGAIVLHDIQKGKVVMSMNTARFFRNGKVKYEQIIHNQPQIEGGGYYCPLVSLNHYGYDLSQEKMDAKEVRTKTALLKRIEIDPTDYLAYFYLAQLCAVRGKAEETILYGEQYIAHKEELGPEGFNPSIYYTMLHNYIKLQKMDKALGCLEEGLKELPNDLDMAFALAEFGVVTNDREKIFLGTRRYLNLYDEFQRHPEMTQGRFTYTNASDAKAYMTYHLVTHSLAEGFNAIKILEQVLPLCESGFRDNLARDLKTALKPFGVDVDVRFTDEPKADRHKKVGMPDQEILRQLEV